MKNILVKGSKKAKVVCIMDVPSERFYLSEQLCNDDAWQVFWHNADLNGFKRTDFCFLSPSPPIPEDMANSEAKVGKFLAEYRQEFLAQLDKHSKKAKAIVVFGKNAGRQLTGRPVKITKIKGVMTSIKDSTLPVLPLLSPQNVVSRPDIRKVFEAEFRQLGFLRDAHWRVEDMGLDGDKLDYQWCLDLSDLIKSKPKVIGIDCETDGLRWARGNKVLTVSISSEAGKALVVPLDCEYYPELTNKARKRLIKQLKWLCANVYTVGHNLKFDINMLSRYGIVFKKWYVDTIQLAFVLDDNMLAKNLDDCVKRWLEEMAGYADQFNRDFDKSSMRTVPHEDMLMYSGADADASLRLAKNMVAEARQDERQWAVFQHVQMPALRSFANIEQEGLGIDRDSLRKFGDYLFAKKDALHSKLVKEAPSAVKRAHLAAGKELALTRDDFVRDILFAKKHGILTKLRLKPLVYTKGSGVGNRIPSTSAKDHLTYFEHIDWVRDYKQFVELNTMASRYVGTDSSKEITEVGRLATGGWPKPVIDSFASTKWAKRIALKRGKGRAGVTHENTTPIEECSVTCTEPHVKSRGKEYAFIRGRDNDRDRIGLITHTEQTGFWKYIGDDERVHAAFALWVTVTGRSSCRDPNLQNIPKRSEIAYEYRKVFKARKGYRLIEVDLSQAELRIAAWMSKDPVMLGIYKKGGDIHAATAAATMGVPLKVFLKGTKDTTPLVDVVSDWTGSEQYLRSYSGGARKAVTVAKYLGYKRYQAKAVNFGFIYGMWWKKFKVYAKTDFKIDMTDKEAEEVRKVFFRTYPNLEKWHRSTKQFVRRHGYVRSLHGAIRRLPSIYSNDESIQKECERQAVNSPVQRFGSDLALLAMSEFTLNCPWDDMRVVAFVHDAVYIEAKKKHAKKAMANLVWLMENQPLEDMFGLKPPLPITADASIGKDLEGMKEVEITGIKPKWISR